MDGRSSDFGRVPAVASDGTSFVDTNGGTKVPVEKHCAPSDEASRRTENADGLLEAGMDVESSKSVSMALKKDLQKCATFPPSASEAQQEYSSCVSDGVPKAALTYERSVSLPPTAKLISAMKGSRQKNGMASPTENRHIKWAPDVYDPPVTSVCHSVNSSYQRRSKPRKKDKNKQKQKQKGRSKKKNQNAAIQNSATHQTSGSKDAGTPSGESALDDLSKRETKILDYGIESHAKCGSSFLRETVAQMHFSAAEAS